MTNFFVPNKPQILIGGGIACMLMGTFLGIKFAPDANKAIEEKKEALGVDKLPLVEYLKIAGIYYGPAISFSAIGAGLVLGGNKMHLENEAAAMAAYAMTNATLETTREKIKEVVGEKKAKDVEEAVAIDTVKKNPPDNRTIIMTGDGDNLCYDAISNQYFRSSINKIEKAINDINFALRDHIISINEYCLKLGIYEIPLGNNLGWDIDQGGYLDVYFTAIIVNGEPCISIYHRNEPHSI